MFYSELENKRKTRIIILSSVLFILIVFCFIFFSGREALAPLFVEEQAEVSTEEEILVLVEEKPAEVLVEKSAEALTETASLENLGENLVKPQGIIDVYIPFTAQAPLANWADQRQQDACEEAASLMAMAWVHGEKETDKKSPADWEQAIISLADWEQEKYGEHRDLFLGDVIKWIFVDYFKYEKVKIKSVASSTDILVELEKGNIVLAPMNGHKLKNPYFTVPGPLTHMILIKGYDYGSHEFITNDPGTRKGENYRYSDKVVLTALNAYPTGSHEEIIKPVKAVIVVEK